jgi:hypothetical protein
MQSGFLGLVVAADSDVNKIFVPSGPAVVPRGSRLGPSLASVRNPATR